MQVADARVLRQMCGLTWLDRIGNEYIKKLRCGEYSRENERID